MEISPRLSLSYVMPQQAQKHVTVNETFRRLDALTQISVKTRSLHQQPSQPVDGDMYLIPFGAIGADWALMAENNLAVFQDNVWVEIKPAAGWLVFVDDESRLYAWSQQQWRVVGGVAEGEPYKSVYQPWRDNDVAVALVLGQSNAEGSETTTPVGPLANVFMMPTASRGWVAFSSQPEAGAVRNNLYRTVTTALSNPATSLAAAWQARIDAGETLPDLYIIHCAGGGQGLSARVEDVDASRWNPARVKSSGGGVADTVSYKFPIAAVEDPQVSLFDLAGEASRAGIRRLIRDGKRPRILGAMWLHGEADATHANSAQEYGAGLAQVHSALASALSTPSLPFFPTYFASESYLAKQAIRTQVDAFLSFAPHSEYLDVRTAPHYNASAEPNFDVFIDGRHYDGVSHDWFAEEFLIKTIGRGLRGFVSEWTERQTKSVKPAFWGTESLAAHYDDDTYRTIILTAEPNQGELYDQTGMFTAPFDGVYRFEFQLVSSRNPSVAQNGTELRIVRNGNLADFLSHTLLTDTNAVVPGSDKLTLHCNATTKLKAGDKISFVVRGFQNKGGWTYGGGYLIA